MHNGFIDGFAVVKRDLVLAMRRCPQPIIAAIDGVCAGAGEDRARKAVEGKAQGQARKEEEEELRTQSAPQRF